MRRTILLALAVLTLVVVFTPPAPAAPASLRGAWHRLNPDPTNPTPAHEVLRCRRIDDSGLHCHYNVRPEPSLGFEDPSGASWGSLVGTVVTSTWTCPAWFGPALCDIDPVRVVAGVVTYLAPDQSVFTVDEELILTEADGAQILYVHWVDQAVCPWYRSFEEALEANPFPLPFDGENWPAMDCTFPR